MQRMLLNRSALGHRSAPCRRQAQVIRCQASKPDGPRKDTSSVVGIPDLHERTDTVEYTDAAVSSETRRMDVSNVTVGTASGQGIGMREETIRVPRTEMITETVEVPEVRMEKQIVQMPESVTVQKEVIVKEVEMRTETITKEVVVLDKVKELHPTTEMKEVVIDRPVFTEYPVSVGRPHEVLKMLKVMRPQDVTQRVMTQRPVERRRKILVKRPYQVKKTVLVEQPVAIMDMLRVEQPEVETVKMAIQVPVKEQRVVEFTDALTKIRPTEGRVVELQVTGKEVVPLSAAQPDHDEVIVAERDWTTIPVGLPFTEVHKRTKEYTVTKLKNDTTPVRQTVMKDAPCEKKGFVMEKVEVEITETEMREEEVEVVETVLEAVEVDVEVTLMNEVEEQWPFTEERIETVTTSDVVLTPHTALMAQLAMKEVEVEVPRTEVYEKDIQKPYTVERKDIVDEVKTVMRDVEVERAVEYMKPIVVERPVTVYDEVTVQRPVTERKDFEIQELQESVTNVSEETATYTTKKKEYKSVGTHIEAVQLGEELEVDPATLKVAITDEELAQASSMTDKLPRVPGTVNAADLKPKKKDYDYELQDHPGIDGTPKKQGFFGMIKDVFTDK